MKKCAIEDYDVSSKCVVRACSPTHIVPSGFYFCN